MWLEHGGVYAIPNLRGGGEYGEDWHKAGMLQHKQNVFDDFIAAAEYLEHEGWTSKAHLAISGGSNGGLLVGAAVTQRPDLFKAVICAVPLLDMLRYHLFGSGKTWVPEYGSAEDQDQFAALWAYSPYRRAIDEGSARTRRCCSTRPITTTASIRCTRASSRRRSRPIRRRMPRSCFASSATPVTAAPTW